MNEIITKKKEFKDLIHVIRGQQVIMDSDLAELYGYEVKQFNRQIKNNQNRFPDDFMFELSVEEYTEILRCKNCTSRYGGRRYLPFVFTEQGIYMLSAVLKGELAEKQSIFIIREFKKMRHYLIENQRLLNNSDLLKLSTTVMQNKEDIQNIKETMVIKTDIDKIMDSFLYDAPIKEITFLEGQKFEANEAYINIYKQAKHTIYVIDNYVDIDTLSLLKYKQKNVDVILFTANKGVLKLHRLEVSNFDREYPSLYVKKIRGFHDRYIILDYGTSDEIMYHCGHSSKDTGNKVSTIHKMLDTEVMHPVIDDVLENGDFLFD